MLSMVEANHLKPILAEGISPVLDGALSVITFPFAEIVIFYNDLWHERCYSSS